MIQQKLNVPNKCNHESTFCFRDLKIDSTSNTTKSPNSFLITLAIIIGVSALAGLAIAIYTLIYMTQTLTTAANTTTCKNCLHSSSICFFSSNYIHIALGINRQDCSRSGKSSGYST